MKTTDVVAVAAQGVRRRPLRSTLTAVSLLIGVVTVVLVQGSSSLIQSATVRQAVLASGPATTVRVGLNDTPVPAAEQEEWWLAHLTAATADLGAEVATAADYPGVTVTGADGASASFELAAVTPGLREIRPFELVSGSWLGAGEDLAPRLAVNRAAASALGGTGPVWLATRDGLGRIRAQVTGVVDDGAPGPTAYVARASAPTLARGGLLPATRTVWVSAPTADRAQLAARITTLAERSGRAADVGEVTRVDAIDQFGDQLATTRAIFLAIAVLSLLVGALGILNIGLATLRERAEELALRRALGASRGQIVAVVLLESQLVALSAAAVAVGIALLGVPLMLQRMSTIPVEFTGLPLSAIALGVGASSAAALAGALAPSVHAGKAPIASLLR